MTAVADGHEVDNEYGVAEGEANPLAENAAPDDLPERHAPRRVLPWIGTLPNPHLVPMVVLNESGYLVPLWTANDLLRGCKYFWHAAQE